MTTTAPPIEESSTAELADPVAHRGVDGRRRGLALVRWVFLAFVSLVMVTPFLWMVLTSVKTPQDLAGIDPPLLPTLWRWQNYLDALSAAPFLTYAWNSLLIAVTHTALTLVFGSMAGYALAKLRFRGSGLIFGWFVGALMIPFYTIVIPLFLMIRFTPFAGGNNLFGQGGSGAIDTYFALLIPGALSPFFIFLFRQFYVSIPTELIEAGRIDGVSEFGILARIMTPQIKPALVTVALLQFEQSWNNFLWPLVVTTRDEMRTIQVGLSVFQRQAETDWALLMAGTTMSALPMILIFLLMQRYFISGFLQAGIK